MNASSQTTSPPVSATVDLALRRLTREFVSGWRELMRHEWNAERASSLHEEIEKLAAAADEKGASDIADPALELTVYLCSFVDGGVHPDAAQQRELQNLVELLAGACGMTQTAATPAKNLPEHKHWQVFYLRANSDDVQGLAAQLGQRGFVVRLCKDTRHLLLTLDTMSPDVLLVDEDFVADVHAIVEAVERKRPPHKDPALCLVLAKQDDASRTSFAQRAGANAVVLDRDPISVAMRIDEMLARRHALGYRVLIVEDDRGQAKFCESILRHRGMVTSICDTAERVPALVAEFKPDLVLLDLYLPDSNGIEVAQRIREQPGTAFLPIVFLSGEHDLDLRFDAISSGADDFITKPVKPRHLITAVESRVRRARQLSAGQSGERGERRGTLSGREAFVQEVARVSREEQERCPTLAMIGVDDAERVRREAGFVASGTIAQQIAAALAAEIKGMRMLCASGELKYLVVRCPKDEDSAREEFESLRKALDARVWGSTDAPQRLRFAAGCLRVPQAVEHVDALIDAAQALFARAQASAARCEFDLHPAQAPDAEDPSQRRLRSLLRLHSLGSAGHFTFQPILQLTGFLTGQYSARLQLQLPQADEKMEYGEFLAQASELNMAAAAERLYMRTLLELARERNANSQSLRIHLSLRAETALDPSFAPWLAAELGSHTVSGNLLVIRVPAERLQGRGASLRTTLEALQRLGLRLGMDLRTADRKIVHELLQVEAINVVTFQRPEDAAWSWADCADLVVEARSLGKTVIVSGLRSIDELGAIVRLGAHYVQADVLAGWSPDWNFEFAAIA
jgi:PleD family two-component response regulator/EAL domain-containing protein (putative c-di-GMP-specific phosphodiesterase class I)